MRGSSWALSADTGELTREIVGSRVENVRLFLTAMIAVTASQGMTLEIPDPDEIQVRGG